MSNQEQGRSLKAKMHDVTRCEKLVGLLGALQSCGRNDILHFFITMSLTSHSPQLLPATLSQDLEPAGDPPASSMSFMGTEDVEPQVSSTWPGQEEEMRAVNEANFMEMLSPTELAREEDGEGACWEGLGEVQGWVDFGSFVTIFLCLCFSRS